MQQELEQKVRERAYQLWTADGRREGMSDRYWLAAEREVLAAFAASSPKPITARRATTLSMPEKASAKPRRRAAAAS